MNKSLLVSALAGGLVFGAQDVGAHCDSLDGPVATAALEALEAQNVNLVLPYAPASAEAELSAAFDQVVAARASGPAAKAVADRYFVETAVRLHRAGDGAPYTGLQPAGTDFGRARGGAPDIDAIGVSQGVPTETVEQGTRSAGASRNERAALARQISDGARASADAALADRRAGAAMATGHRREVIGAEDVLRAWQGRRGMPPLVAH